ncbi:ABC transporter substrate-binding protein [Chryseobacterium sp.]|uniref:ABC transporter substrate-binding protein n=1 Tax=Chryseobacterium sp. TaxID=1871047 RepID=UPI0025C0A20F|nr:ABC transporter substrate-binding protein [Chryseobacterium sp.]
MKLKILLLIAFWTLISCKREQKISSSDWASISGRLEYKEETDVFKLKSGNFTYDFKADQLPFKKVIILNASMIGYISELGLENTLVGVSSPEYIYSDKVKQLIAEGKIQNIGSDQKYNVEKIISLHPDVIFTNYIASFENTYQLLKNNGVQVVFLDEYLEQKPLERSAYLKLFGELLGKNKEADAHYQEIEKNYNELKKLALTAKDKPVVLANEMYGDIWYLPGGKTYMANYISDANADYILEDNKEEKSVTMSFEEVYAKSQKVNYWVNAGNHISKKEMLNINPLYGKLEVFRTGMVYGIGGREKGKSNDFFESGVVRSDWVLKDYIKIFHPELLPDDQLTYMKELQ